MIPVEQLWSMRGRYIRNRWTGSDCFVTEGTVTPYGQWVGDWLTLIEKEIARRTGMSGAARTSTFSAVMFSVAHGHTSGFEEWRDEIMRRMK